MCTIAGLEHPSGSGIDGREANEASPRLRNITFPLEAIKMPSAQIQESALSGANG